MIYTQDQVITLNMAKNLRHGTTILHKESGRRWRVNGRPKTWVLTPSKVEVPLKYGLYDGGYLTEEDLDDYILEYPPEIAEEMRTRKYIGQRRGILTRQGIKRLEMEGDMSPNTPVTFDLYYVKGAYVAFNIWSRYGGFYGEILQVGMTSEDGIEVHDLEEWQHEQTQLAYPLRKDGVGEDSA